MASIARERGWVRGWETGNLKSWETEGVPTRSPDFQVFRFAGFHPCTFDTSRCALTCNAFGMYRNHCPGLPQTSNRQLQLSQARAARSLFLAICHDKVKIYF